MIKLLNIAMLSKNSKKSFLIKTNSVKALFEIEIPNNIVVIDSIQLQISKNNKKID